jgi:PAS domain S-box-containing protein
LLCLPQKIHFVSASKSHALADQTQVGRQGNDTPGIKQIMADMEHFAGQPAPAGSSDGARALDAITSTEVATPDQSEVAPLQSTSETTLLRRLQAVTDIALSHLSLAELQADLLERIRNLLCGDIAMMLLLTSDGEHLSMSASSGIAGGFEEQTSRQIRIPIGRGVAGRIAAERQPLIFEDLEDEEVLNPVLREKGVRSLVGAPLLIKERVMGVVYVGTTRLHSFTRDDAELLQLAGDRFAVAIERAQLYEAVREAEIRKSALLEAALDCIIIMDQQGLVVEFNPSAERTFGYQRAAAIGQPLADLIIPPPLREAHNRGLEHYLATGHGPVINQRTEITGMRADGTLFPVELTVIPLSLHEGTFFTGYLRDITQRKEAEAERDHLLARAEAARVEAEAANRAKDEFLSTLSHELRTPLTPLLGWTQMLLSHKLDETASEDALHSILRNVKTQTRLVEDLLDVSRIITGKLDLETCPLEMEPIILEAIATVRAEAEAKDISLRTVLDSGAGTILGDRDRLLQVIWNLLSNAIKFTPRGGRIEVKLERADAHTQLQVCDSGIGISAEFLPFVFDRLRQADSSNTRPHGGLGLGLAIVQHLVQLHSGEVQAQSAGMGQGSTFTVKLPLRVSQAPSPPLTVERNHATQPPSPSNVTTMPGEEATILDGLKVLVVDDDADVRQLVTVILEQAGASVLVASSAREALESLKQSRPSVMVSDIGMPGEDGYTLIQKVRSLPPEQGGQTPALALTAYAGSEDRRQVLAAGYQSHVAKPVDALQLILEVAHLNLQN